MRSLPMGKKAELYHKRRAPAPPRESTGTQPNTKAREAVPLEHEELEGRRVSAEEPSISTEFVAPLTAVGKISVPPFLRCVLYSDHLFCWHRGMEDKLVDIFVCFWACGREVGRGVSL